jgi:hypothetical protein
MSHTRFDVQDRFQNDPQFKYLVDMLTAWLIDHPDFTPTELREAAMCAAQRCDAMTLKDLYFSPDGTLIGRRQYPR